MSDDRVTVSVAKIYDRMGALGMNLTMLSQTTNTNMWSIVKSGRTTSITAAEIANALHCQLSDIVTGVPEEPRTARVSFGPTCYESGNCFARADDGSCKILRETYGRYEKRCPFRKEKRSERPCAD